MANKVERLFISVFKNEMTHEIVCEGQLPNGNWIKVEVTFDPIKRTTISELPHTYVPTGLEPRAFFRQSVHQYGTRLTLLALKALQNYETDVFPHFQEAAQILSEHGYPMEEVERLCA